MSSLNEGRFHELVDTLLQHLEDWFEETGLDLDIDNAGGLLTVAFANGSQLIFSRQTPLSQLWVAARSGGYHFDYVTAENHWANDVDGRSLAVWIGQLVLEQTGETVDTSGLS